ncbi:MAG TPA: ribose-5-phosphate isomerase RpiA [Acidobacteriaceae bacterium]|nr:ribose-5-phosphate isomerase RpiA [Acidobacteriaceae bacterium]
MTQDEAKLLVAKRAAELVRDGQAVGLGTGTTATLFIRELAKRKLKIRCVASSDASHDLGRELGMDVVTLEELPELDVYIDGADEVCRRAGGGSGPGLDLIKGGGGALLREKIVASAAKEFIVVADSTKLVDVLGRFPLPVEVIQMALPLVEPKLKALGLNPRLRMKKGSPGEVFVTDEGNYILDCACGRIEEPEVTAAEIRSIVGVVEHGLFLGMATLALVAGEDGVREIR